MNNSFIRLKTFVQREYEIHETLKNIVKNELIPQFMTNFSSLEFSNFTIDYGGLTFDLDFKFDKLFFIDTEIDFCGYNSNVTCYNGSDSLTINIQLADERIPTYIDSDNHFHLLPSEIYEFLSSNKQINETVFQSNWRTFGIQRAEQHIQKIENLIEEYKKRI